MVSSASGWESCTAACKSMKLEYFSHQTNINSKWLKDLIIRYDTIKLFEGNIGKTFSDINCTNVFLGQSHKAIEIKAKINKQDLIKLKSYCTVKETLKKAKRQPSEWEKIFANDAGDKVKICSTSLTIRETQIKTTMMYHHTQFKMAIIKKSTNNKCWRGCGEKGTLLHCWW